MDPARGQERIDCAVIFALLCVLGYGLVGMWVGIRLYFLIEDRIDRAFAAGVGGALWPLGIWFVAALYIIRDIEASKEENTE